MLRKNAQWSSGKGQLSVEVRVDGTCVRSEGRKAGVRPRYRCMEKEHIGQINHDSTKQQLKDI